MIHAPYSSPEPAGLHASHVAPFADFAFVHLSFICCSILCSMFSEFIVTPGFFRFYVLLDSFLSCRFGSVSKEMNSGPVLVSDWSQWRPDWRVPEGKLKHSIVTWFNAVCLLCVVLDASPQEYTECWEWVNCTKNPVLHWMLFNCCFSRSLMQVHQAVILCFVFVFFNYLRSPSSSRLVLFQLSCSLMPIKTNLTKSVCFILRFFFLRSCKASWETPVRVDVYTTVVWSDSLWELIV